MLPLAAPMMLLTACGAASFNPPIQTARALPPLYAYSKAFQLKAADELDNGLPACARMEGMGECSALRTMIADYKTVRDGLRVLGAKEQ